MRQSAELSLVVFVGWLALFSVVSGNVAYDCVTHAPLGQSEYDAQTGTDPAHPTLVLIIGKKGDMTYTRSEPFPVKISYSGGGISSFLLTANPPSNTDTLPLGTFTVNSGPALTNSCGSANNSLIAGNLGQTGVINASWTASASQSGFIEFKITVVNNEGKFWIWNSALTMESSAETARLFHQIW